MEIKGKEGTEVRFFHVMVKSVMMCIGKSLTLTETLEKRLDGVYTRMLRATFDTPEKRHATHKELWGLAKIK